MKSRGLKLTRLTGVANLYTPETLTKDREAQAGPASTSHASTALGLELFRINVETQGSEVIKAMKNVGYKYKLKDISLKLDKITAKVMNKLTDLAVAASKSVVPIRGGDLRDNHIKATGDPYEGPNTPGRFSSGTSSLLSRDVYVDNRLHVARGYKTSKRYAASSLADFKNYNKQRRSRESEAQAPFSSVSGSSQGWIDLARAEFKKVIKSEVTKLLRSK